MEVFIMTLGLAALSIRDSGVGIDLRVNYRMDFTLPPIIYLTIPNMLLAGSYSWL